MPDVDDEQHVGDAVHVLDAAQAAFELRELAPEREPLLLAHPVEAAFLDQRLELLQPLDRLLDGAVVGQHAAEPAPVDVGHRTPLRLGRDALLGRPLGADEQDGAAVRGHAAEKVQGVVVEGKGLLEIDDVDLVAFAEDVGKHLRVPEACLVAEVDAGLQHVAHRHCCHGACLCDGLSLHAPRRVDHELPLVAPGRACRRMCGMSPAALLPGGRVYTIPGSPRQFSSHGHRT